MKIRNITETTAGATSSGSVASVAKPLGKMQERTEVSGLHTAEKVMKGKTKKKGPYRNSLSESEFNTKQQVIDYFVKRGKTAQQGAAAWERGWRGTKKPTKSTKPASDWMARWENDKQERENKLSEAELSEQDLIIVPGMRKIKDTSFIPHKLDRRDHEVEMARSEIYAAAKDAMRIFKLLKDRTEDQGIMGWQQSYITLASDYLNSVADSLDYDANVQEMTGGVLAGGMSNFEEGASEDNDTIYNNWRKDLGTDYDTTLNLVDKDHDPNKPRNVADELAKMNKKLKGVAEGIARGPKEKKLYELLSSWLHFISFKTVKIPNDAIDANGHQILASMQKHYLGPVINGMTMGEILKGDLWQNPKVIPHLLKYIYQGIPYIQERIKKFVKPSEQQNYLSAVEKIKQLYKESVAQYSQGVAEGQNSSPWDQMAHLQSKSNKELDELVRFWQRSLEKNPNHKVANDQLHIIKMIRAERIGRKGVAEGRDNPLQDIDPRGWHLVRGDRPIAINFPDEYTAKSFHSGHGYGRETKILHGSQVRQNAYLQHNPGVINYPEYSKGVAEGWPDYDDNQYSLTDSTGKELTLLRGNTPEEAIERAKQLIGSNEKLLATFGLVKLTPRPHYIVRNAKRQGVAEGSDVEYVVVIRDEHGKRSIRVSALTPTDAKEKAEAQGYKVIKVKDPREAHYFREQAVAETLMKCPKCGGPSYLDQKIAEEKDACYHKVKSRYKVWPSAYASGALVRCRKVGASNWGNKSKK